MESLEIKQKSNCNLLKIKKMSIIFYVLNLIDAFATYYLVNTGVFYEVNPLMNKALSNTPIMFFLIKIVIVAYILYLMYKYAKNNINKASEINGIKKGLAVIVVIYTIVDINHLFNYFYLNLLF